MQTSGFLLVLGAALVAVAACGGDPGHEREAASGGGLTNGDGAGATGDSAAGEPGTSEPGPRSCSSASECVHPEYWRPVATESDCYCMICPGDFGRQPPLNEATHALYREQWIEVCSEWLERTPCPPFPCPLPEPAICDSGQCAPAE